MELFIRMIEYADLADVFLINQFQMRSNNLQTKHNNNSSMYLYFWLHPQNRYWNRIESSVRSRNRSIDNFINSSPLMCRQARFDQSIIY